jgi:phage terminase small subunit
MLSNNQKLFCQEYLKLGMNGTQAYLNVYKNCKKEETAMASASRLLRNDKVKEYIQELQKKVEEKTTVTIEDIVNELTAIAFADRTKISKVVNEKIEIDENTKVNMPNVIMSNTDNLDIKEKKVIAGYKKTRNGVSVETYDKVKALELLGKYLGMFTETVKIENPEATKILSSISRQLGGKSE